MSSGGGFGGGGTEQSRRALVGLPGGASEGDGEDLMATEDLRAAAALMGEAQRVANIGSWEWHLSDGAAKWSDQLYRIFGLEQPGFQPTLEGYLAHVHPEDRKFVRRMVEEGIEERSPFRFEHRIIRSDGQE